MNKSTVIFEVSGDDRKQSLAVMKNVAALLSQAGVAVRLEDPEALNRAYRDLESIRTEVFVILKEKA